VSRELDIGWHFIDRHVADGCSGKPAFIDRTGPHTYAELASLVRKSGNLLRSLGVERGDRVMLCLNDSVFFPALFLGAMRIAAVPIPVNTLLVPEDYSYLLRDSQPRLLVVSAALLDRFAPAIKSNFVADRVLIEGADRYGFSRLESALARSDGILECENVAPDDLGFILYSSGSTGEPKGVMHRRQDLLKSAALYSDGVLKIRSDDVTFSASKMFFAYGLGNSCTFPLHTGAAAVLIADRPTPETVVAILREHRVTIFFGFPTLYASLLAYTADQIPALPNLRLCVSAGEALPETIGRAWCQRFGVEILDGIGSTEALHIFISNRPDDIRYGSSGKVVQGYDVSLRGDDGVEIKAEQIGDLYCRGPSIALGYWNKPEATRRTFVDGWLRTGDKYYRDEQGYYHYAGRGDDMLKVAGVWVSPHEVEAALIAHPAVLEAAVVPHLSSEGLVKPKAFVVLKDPGTASDEIAHELRQFVKSRIAAYKQPHWIEFRNELPKTATGKIRRNLLRESK
jgi:4-hydroxybenzoate-CoA ligase